ncbi:MAG: hypothetical protein H0T92_04220 [Pyrinomonadaceae bacterium]|nr:hypothetical protein [Pyrinomonadaceae bacterium]
MLQARTPERIARGNRTASMVRQTDSGGLYLRGLRLRHAFNLDEMRLWVTGR